MEAVGFDMDHTLAQYKAEPFDQLAYRGALDKLVSLGYPAAVRVRARAAHRVESSARALAWAPRARAPTAPPPPAPLLAGL
jgi:phosphoserine phosphatase